MADGYDTSDQGDDGSDGADDDYPTSTADDGFDQAADPGAGTGGHDDYPTSTADDGFDQAADPGAGTGGHDDYPTSTADDGFDQAADPGAGTGGHDDYPTSTADDGFDQAADPGAGTGGHDDYPTSTADDGSDAGYTLIFDIEAGTLTVNPGDGRDSYTLPATSGKGEAMNDKSAVDLKDHGPLPPGEYKVNMGQLSNPGAFGDWARNFFTGDWGDWRVPLEPVSVPGIGDRDGFFLHGGNNPGSAGCVDIGGGWYGNDHDYMDRVLGDLSARSGQPVRLLVR